MLPGVVLGSPDEDFNGRSSDGAGVPGPDHEWQEAGQLLICWRLINHKHKGISIIRYMGGDVKENGRVRRGILGRAVGKSFGRGRPCFRGDLRFLETCKTLGGIMVSMNLNLVAGAWGVLTVGKR